MGLLRRSNAPGGMSEAERVDGYVQPPAQRPRHEDPGADGPFEPKPAARAALPTIVLHQVVHTVPPGHVARFRWRMRDGGQWSEWSTRAGPCEIRQPYAFDLSEFQTGPAGVAFEPAPA